jgi:hypothetical protein
MVCIEAPFDKLVDKQVSVDTELVQELEQDTVAVLDIELALVLGMELVVDMERELDMVYQQELEQDTVAVQGP